MKTIVFLIVAAATASAQVVTGTIGGKVSDSSGATIPNAKIVVQNTNTGFERTIQTNAEGIYSLPFLPTGRYDVTAEATGFQPAARRNIDLAADQKAAADFSLSPGNLNETVTVSAAADQVNRTSSEISQTIQQKTAVDLPIRGRDFTQLAYLTPGVETGRQGEQLSGGGVTTIRSNIAFNANGMRSTTNSFILDGVDNNEQGLDFTASILPVLDAIQEFQVITANFSAEYGRAMGGIINVTTRGGTNQLHGSLYEFLRNSSLDARDYFAQPGSSVPFRRNQFGGTVGAPIVRNKLFFFGDYEGLRLRQAQNYLVTVPTDAMKSGDFTGLATIYDPLSTHPNPANPSQSIRDPFAGNRIPEPRMDSASKIIAPLYPSPNLRGAANNYASNPRLTRSDDQFDIRLDHQINQQNNYFLRYSFDQTSRFDPSALLTPQNPNGGTCGAGAFCGTADIRAQGASLNFNHVFRPTLVNEFRIGYNRFSIADVPVGFGVDPNSFGIPGLNVSGAARGLPLLTVAGVAQLGTTNVLPVFTTSNDYQFLETLSIVRGRHSMRLGGGAVRRQANQYIAPTPAGNFSFNANFTSNLGAAGTGHPFASFLLGYPSNTVRSYLPGTQGKRNTEWSAFFQDDLHLGRVTLNLGLRYEVYPPGTEVAGRQANFDPATGTMFTAATDPHGSGLRRANWKNFGPRVGLAWDVTGKGTTVVRSSYGISYSQELFGLNSYQTLNIPFFIDQTITPGSFDPINRLSDGLPIPVLDAKHPSGLIRAINPDYRQGAAQMISSSVQRQVRSNLMLEGGFVATMGHHLTGFRDINQSVPGTGAANPRRPFYSIAPDVGRIFYTDSGVNSHYQGLLLKATRRFAAGLTFLAAYTYSRAIDNTEGTVPGGYPFPMDSQHLYLEKAVASFDRTQRFSFSGTYELPFGRKQRFLNSLPRALDVIAANWQVNAIVTLATGTPFPLSLNTPVSGSNGFTERPDRIANGNLPADRRTVQRWFDTSAFTVPAVGRFGSAGRNIVRGPGQQVIDFSLFKDFPIKERLRLQYRAEAYNLLNTPQLGAPNGSLGAPAFGIISGTASNNRQVQMALKLLF